MARCAGTSQREKPLPASLATLLGEFAGCFSPKESERSRAELPAAPAVRSPGRVSEYVATMSGAVAERFRVKTHRAPA